MYARAAVLPWSVRIVPSGIPDASWRTRVHHWRAARVLLAALAINISGTSLSRDDIPADQLPSAGTNGASTIVVDERRHRVWSVNSDSDTVAVIDAVKFVRLAETSVGKNPRTLAIAPDGTVWVVNQDDATISLVDGGTVRERARIALPYASRPYGIAFSPGGDVAYVTLQATDRLLEIVGDGTVERAVDVGPTPRGVAVSADGRRVFVTRYISPVDHGVVTEVDARSMKIVRHFELAVDPGPDSPVGGRGVPNHLAAIAIAPDGRHAWIPSKKDNTGRGLHLSGEALTFESTTRAIVSQLDLGANREILAARRDLDDRAMAVAVAFDPRGGHAFVALQGSNAVDVLDARTGALTTSVSDTGFAPQGLAVDRRGRLFVQNFLSRDVAVYDVSDVAPGAEIALLGRIATVEREPLPEVVLLGKRVFYNAADPRMSRDGYVSCAGCHIEGGSDGRVWDYSDRGAHGGGLRNTKSLLGPAGMAHGPLHWRADMDEIQDFEILVRTTLQGRGFVSDAVFDARRADWVFGPSNAGLSPELDALAAYLATFDEVNPSPHRHPGGVMTEEALAGEFIFHSPETGCATCHAGARFTDSSLQRKPAGGSRETHALPFPMHDVGTLSRAAGDFRPNTLRALDTPTVKGVWETPPYLHDGSAATLMDVITVRNPGDRHGRTTQLTPMQKTQLVAYLEQLDDTAVDTSINIAPLDPANVVPGVLGFEVAVGERGGVGVESVTVRLEASGRAASTAAIYVDGNGNGRVDDDDSLVGQETLEGSGTQTIRFPTTVLIEAGHAASLLVAVDHSVVVLTDVGARGLTSRTRSRVMGTPL
ncbi:MAG: hypothetical protein OXI79_12415 [Gammaproteobacteria bacterium]|nr:hypothetical protein [Gammaproteobacteria bacterium]